MLNAMVPIETQPAPAEARAETMAPGAAAAPGSSALGDAGGFLRSFWLRIAAVSAAVLAPCFWHAHIEAGDLGSHVYNAWLVQLIERGQAPGLWLARQWTNILFDVMLTGFGRIWGLHAAERIATATAVLVFFWGAFALICALSRRVPWFVLPFLAAVAYGWTFSMGFMNFYLSLGFAFAGVAIVARGRGRERLLALAMVPLILLAHPLGLVLLAGAGAYILLAQRLRPRQQLYLFGAAGFLLLLTRVIVAGHYDVLWTGPLYMFNGADQLLLYRTQYRFPYVLVLAFVPLCLAADVWRRRGTRELLAPYRLPLQLYGVAILAALLLPSLVDTQRNPGAPVSFLVERLTTVTAVFGCSLVGTIEPRRWHLVGFASIAVVFFFYLYGDTGKIDAMETQAEHYASALPPGQRVVATIWPFFGGRVFINHIVDRACIGHCFSYGNYEAAALQFRVRAQRGNGIVAANYADTNAIQFGDYIVQPRDLPIYQIYQCSLNMTDLCMRPLSLGERNGQYGLQVPH
jgi:hypothetical protein